MTDDRTVPGGEGPWKKVPADHPILEKLPASVQEFLTQVGLPDSWLLNTRFDFSFQPLKDGWQIGSDNHGPICLDPSGAMHTETRFINSSPHHFFLSRLAFRNREMEVVKQDLTPEQIEKLDDALAAQLAKIDPPAMDDSAWWPRVVNSLRPGVR